MATERVGDMTLAELRAFIRETIDVYEDTAKPDAVLSAAEIVEVVRRHRPILPAGSLSNQELLREDRDR